MSDTKKELYQHVADVIASMSFVDIDLMVDALFAKSETLPYTFNRAIHCNLKKREDALRNDLLGLPKKD